MATDDLCPGCGEVGELDRARQLAPGLGMTRVCLDPDCRVGTYLDASAEPQPNSVTVAEKLATACRVAWKMLDTGDAHGKDATAAMVLLQDAERVWNEFRASPGLKPQGCPCGCPTNHYVCWPGAKVDGGSR